MPEPIALDALYDLTTITELVLSPDGERAAFVASERSRDEEENRSSLFVVPTDGGRASHRLTRASDAGSPEWSPDGSRLGFLAAREQDVELTVADEDDGDGENGEDEEDADGEAKDDENGDEEDGEDEPPGSGDGEPKPQLWVFDLGLGGDARQVTDREEGSGSSTGGPTASGS